MILPADHQVFRVLISATQDLAGLCASFFDELAAARQPKVFFLQPDSGSDLVVPTLKAMCERATGSEMSDATLPWRADPKAEHLFALYG